MPSSFNVTTTPLASFHASATLTYHNVQGTLEADRSRSCTPPCADLRRGRVPAQTRGYTRVNTTLFLLLPHLAMITSNDLLIHNVIHAGEVSNDNTALSNRTLQPTLRYDINDCAESNEGKKLCRPDQHRVEYKCLIDKTENRIRSVPSSVRSGD